MPSAAIYCGRCGITMPDGIQQACRDNHCTHGAVCDACAPTRLYMCEYHERHHVPSTPRCTINYNLCMNACGHGHCEGGVAHCLGLVAETCDYCSNCTDHCRCDDDDEDSEEEGGIEFFKNAPKFWPGKNTFVQLQSKRFIAAEIEVAKVDNGIPINMAVMKWRGCIVHDGSLPGSGFEINTSPASLGMYEDQLREIGSALEHGKAKTSRECGLHVHVDCRDFDYYEARRLMGLWSLLESTMFKLVDPSRVSNRYCHPVAMRYAVNAVDGIIGKHNPRIDVFKAIYNRTPSQSDNISVAKEHKYNDARYAALNLHSWAYRGTVENRMHHGTINAEDIINWGYLNAAIADHASRLKDSDVAELATDEQNIADYLCSIPHPKVGDWVKAKLGAVRV